MTVSKIAQKMVVFSQGNRHDINHFMKVYAYARTIGRCEGLDSAAQTVLEAAAIVHDIACPLCREKYGSTAGRYQELEGPALARELLADSGLDPKDIDRIAWLVGHHHTPQDADGPDYQILIEADYLVNADENGLSREQVETALERIFQTGTGRALLRSMYL